MSLAPAEVRNRHHKEYWEMFRGLGELGDLTNGVAVGERGCEAEAEGGEAIGGGERGSDWGRTVREQRGDEVIVVRGLDTGGKSGVHLQDQGCPEDRDVFVQIEEAGSGGLPARQGVRNPQAVFKGDTVFQACNPEGSVYGKNRPSGLLSAFPVGKDDPEVVLHSVARKNLVFHSGDVRFQDIGIRGVQGFVGDCQGVSKSGTNDWDPRVGRRLPVCRGIEGGTKFVPDSSGNTVNLGTRVQNSVGQVCPQPSADDRVLWVHHRLVQGQAASIESKEGEGTECDRGRYQSLHARNEVNSENGGKINGGVGSRCTSLRGCSAVEDLSGTDKVPQRERVVGYDSCSTPAGIVPVMGSGEEVVGGQGEVVSPGGPDNRRVFGRIEEQGLDWLWSGSWRGQSEILDGGKISKFSSGAVDCTPRASGSKTNGGVTGSGPVGFGGKGSSTMDRQHGGTSSAKERDCVRPGHECHGAHDCDRGDKERFGNLGSNIHPVQVEPCRRTFSIGGQGLLDDQRLDKDPIHRESLPAYDGRFCLPRIDGAPAVPIMGAIPRDGCFECLCQGMGRLGVDGTPVVNGGEGHRHTVGKKGACCSPCPAVALRVVVLPFAWGDLGLRFGVYRSSGVRTVRCPDGTAINFAHKVGIGLVLPGEIRDDLEPAVRTRYLQAGARFDAWCTERGHCAFPASDDVFDEYLHGCLSRGQGGAVISNVSAIRRLHKDLGLRVPLCNPAIMRAARKHKRKADDVRPFPAAWAVSAFKSCEVIWQPLTVVAALGCRLMMRPGEFVRLWVSDVRRGIAGVWVRLRRRKGDVVLRKDPWHFIACGEGLLDVFCLACFVWKCAVCRAVGKQSIDIPLFVDKDGRALESEFVAHIFNALAALLGNEQEVFVGKSGRVGGAVAAVIGGASELEVRITGDWRGESLRRYVGGVMAMRSGIGSAIMQGSMFN